MNDLLEDGIFTVEMGGATSRMALPCVLDALSRDAVDGFTALRPHQRPYWHMFLCQVAALAIERIGHRPVGAEEWKGALVSLSGSKEAWQLVVMDETKPAFLQPPVILGELDIKQPEVHEAPDEIDLPLQSKGHAVKRGSLRMTATAEHWIYALVCRQTAGGYGGKNWYGVIRSAGNWHPRHFVGLTPSSRPGAWFIRDVAALAATKGSILEKNPHLDGSHRFPLLWTLPWDGIEQLPITDFGPWTVEACMRLRLVGRGTGFACIRRKSSGRRIAEGGGKGKRSLAGNVGDPWAVMDVPWGAAAKIVPGKPPLEWTARLLFDQAAYLLPPLARRIDGVDGQGAMTLAIRAVVTDDGKSNWSERSFDLPERKRFSFSNAVNAPAALDQLADIQVAHQKVLLPAIFAWHEGDGSKVDGIDGARVRAAYQEIARDVFDAALEAPFLACVIEAEQDPEGAKALWRNALAAACREAYAAFLRSTQKSDVSWRRRRAQGVCALRALMKTNIPVQKTPDDEKTIDKTGKATTDMSNPNQSGAERKMAETQAIAHRIIGILSDPNYPAANLSEIRSWDRNALSGTLPRPIWLVIAQSMPVEMQGSLVDTPEVYDWAVFIRIAAIATKAGFSGMGFGKAMKEAGIGEVRMARIVSAQDQWDFRTALTQAAKQIADAGISWSVADAAPLLVSRGAVRDALVEKVDIDYMLKSR